ncbi:LysR family transcriptional regulator [uncultured Megasphaera sp.]|uniref:LysR family transcriptional regulator n=1 Tax=uncultured Megasphaera sp. TaxID=165188 RepID=UPI0025D01129|nr:LysR family transcriptional regulator [uncultured Megasphaera sp.]
MLFRQMKHFIAVVEAKSFTEASYVLEISQSAVSQQIKALEEDLGVPLLIRHNRRFALTPAGDYFYRHGKELLQEIESFKDETRRQGEDKELQLRIGYLNNYVGSELYETIAAFSTYYPEVTIHIFNGTHESLYHEIRQRKADLLLSDQRRAFSDLYENNMIMTGPVYAEISRLNPLSRQKRLSLKELKRLPCILVTAEDHEPSETAYYTDTLGFADNFLFARTIEEARLLVAGNRGYLPLERLSPPDSSDTAACCLPLYRDGNPLMRHYCLFWHKDNSTYYIEEFARLLHERIDQSQQP